MNHLRQSISHATPYYFGRWHPIFRYKLLLLALGYDMGPQRLYEVGLTNAYFELNGREGAD